MIGWLLLFFATIALFVYAGEMKNAKRCKGVKVEVVGQKKYVFVNEEQIKSIVAANGGKAGYIVDSVNLRKIEQVLYKDVWVKKADLFFDNNQILQVRIDQSDPIARIFTDKGNTFYIDSAAKKLPVNNKVSARVPVFTSFPESNRAEDYSMLIHHIQELSSFINKDAFWTAMISQINIVNKKEFEFVPVVGNHLVAMGTADSMENKFNRLYSFYKQVWVSKGLDKYKKINVQYNGQVVATLRDSTNKNDAVFGISMKADSVKADPAKDKNRLADKNIQVKKEEMKKEEKISPKKQENKKTPPVEATKEKKYTTSKK